MALPVTEDLDVQRSEGQGKRAVDQSECICTQPTVNRILPHHSTDQAPPPHSDRSEGCDISGEDSVTDSLSSSGNSRLLYETASSPEPHRTHSGADCSKSCKRKSCSLHHHHHHHHHQRLTSSKSQASNETDAAHIKRAAGGDCCVHCLLACLFCELPSLCSALGQCLFCGVGGACVEGGACCCCPDALIGCCCLEVGCCEALMDCGIVEDCCGSLDCLEICLECCSICFPS